MSLLFYERILIVYFIPGHSHMLPDRVVAWSKHSLACRNLYCPEDIVESMNNVRTIKAQFLDHVRPIGSGNKKLPAPTPNQPSVLRFFGKV